MNDDKVFGGFVVGFVVSMLLFAFLEFFVDTKIITNKKITPSLRIKIENGITDTTYIYKE